jgi:hypothetical protein
LEQLVISRIAATTFAIAAAALFSQAASAQSTFHVKELDYKQGDWVIETINAYQGGFRPRSDRTQAGHELGIGYTVTNWWSPKLLISFDKEQGNAYEVQRLLFENVFPIKTLADKQDGIAFAWFQSVEAALNNEQTNATAFGPILTFQAGKFSFSSNTFFEKTFGQNREQGMNFLLAWQARYELMDKVKLALEGYAAVPEIGAGTRTPQTGTSHRIGPAVIFEVDLPGFTSQRSHGGAGSALHGVRKAGIETKEPPHAEIEVGVLFGTTEYTPDVTGKINTHIRF